MRLKSCAGKQRATDRTVGDHEQRHLRTGQILLDHHPVARGQHGRTVLDRDGAVVGNDDTLTRGETVVLDDVRRTEHVEGGLQLVRRRAGARPRRWHAGGDHDFFRDGLRALQLRRRARRSEHGNAFGAYGIGDARDERRLRTDHHEIGVLVDG